MPFPECFAHLRFRSRPPVRQPARVVRTQLPQLPRPLSAHLRQPWGVPVIPRDLCGNAHPAGLGARNVQASRRRRSKRMSIGPGSNSLGMVEEENAEQHKSSVVAMAELQDHF